MITAIVRSLAEKFYRDDSSSFLVTFILAINLDIVIIYRMWLGWGKLFN